VITARCSIVRRFVLILLLGALSLAPSAWARQSDEVTVGVAIEPRRTRVGEPVLLELVVNNAEPEGGVQTPEIEGLRFDSLGSSTQRSSSMQVINGRMVRDERMAWRQRYRVLPARKGRFEIPPFEVRVDGETLVTAPVTLVVDEARPRGPLRAFLDMPDGPVYVGQPVPVRLTLLSPGNMNFPEFTTAGDWERMRVERLRGSEPQRGRGVRWLGELSWYEPAQRQIQGERWGGVVITRLVIPDEAGVFTIGPVITSTTVSEGRRRNIEAIATTDAVQLEVLPLPEGGPAGFTGLVGAFDVSTRADVTELSVGDPIRFQVRVRGNEPVERVPDLDLDSMSGFVDRFRVSDRVEREERVTDDGAEVVFSQVIRPLDGAIEAIPEVRLPFFNPDTGRYEFATSQPIPVRVRGGRVVNAGDAVGADGTPPSATLEENTDDRGIRANASPAEALARDGSSARGALTSPLFVGAVALPPLAFACVVVVALVRRRNAGAAPARIKKTALARLRSEAQRSDDGGALARAVYDYFGGVTGKPAASMTPREAGDVLLPLDRDDGCRLVELLEGCEASRYAGLSEPNATRGVSEELIAIIQRHDASLRGDA
jgi:hypothetical protein